MFSKNSVLLSFIFWLGVYTFLNIWYHCIVILKPHSLQVTFKIRGTSAPKSQDWPKWLLPDGSTGGLVVSKAHPLTVISVILTGFCYFSNQVATQLSSRGWVDPIPDPVLQEKFLGYSRESNLGPLGWQSDVPTIPNRQSVCRTVCCCVWMQQRISILQLFEPLLCLQVDFQSCLLHNCAFWTEIVHLVGMFAELQRAYLPVFCWIFSVMCSLGLCLCTNQVNLHFPSFHRGLLTKLPSII